MKKLRSTHSIFAAAIAAIAVAPAQATLVPQPAGAVLAPAEGAARPIPAWRRFCDEFQSDCEVDPSEAETVKLSRSSWQQIVAVNARVNATIKPLTDEAHWGVADSWNYPTDGYGDCEDYQLLKRKLLVEAGLPRRALRITVVVDEKGEGHAVLMVRTDRGDFILDNKTSTVLPWEQTGYVFVKREGQDDLAWVSLNGVKSPTTTANR